MRISVLLCGSCMLVPAIGCGSSSGDAVAAPAAVAMAAQPEAKAPTPQPSAAPAPAPSGPAPSTIDDSSFSLRLLQAGPYKPGELGRFVLQLQALGIYHVNQEFPIEITLSADADTALPKAKLERADAAEFGEKSARFEVPFTAKVAGDHTVHANVRFAVCTPETCVPDERNLSLALAVK